MDVYGDLDYDSLSCCPRDLAVHGNAKDWLRNLTNLSRQMWWLEDIRVELDDWNNWVSDTEARTETRASRNDENQDEIDTGEDEFFETHQSLEDLVAGSEGLVVRGILSESSNDTSSNRSGGVVERDERQDAQETVSSVIAEQPKMRQVLASEMSEADKGVVRGAGPVMSTLRKPEKKVAVQRKISR